jgi:hypothetical protein
MKVLSTDAPLSAYYDADRTAPGLGAPGGEALHAHQAPWNVHQEIGAWLELEPLLLMPPHAASRLCRPQKAQAKSSNDHAEVAGDDGQKKRNGDGVFHGSVRKEESHDGARSHGLTLSAQYDGCNTSRRKARPQNVGIIDAAQRSERYAPLV